MGNFKDEMGYHFKGEQLYFQHHKIDEVIDRDSFVIIDQTHAKDKIHVFDVMQIIADADPDTYQVLTTSLAQLNNRFSKDKNCVYFGTNKVNGADPKTFVVIDEFHGITLYRK